MPLTREALCAVSGAIALTALLCLLAVVKLRLTIWFVAV
jgi:hypothetical protein